MVGGWTKDFAMKPLYNIMEGIWMDKENIELLKSFLTPFHFQRGLEPEFIIYSPFKTSKTYCHSSDTLLVHPLLPDHLYLSA